MAAATRSILRSVVYGGVWVLIWGTAASLADTVLLDRGAYVAGTWAQAITFLSYGLACLVLAVRISRRFLGSGPAEVEVDSGAVQAEAISEVDPVDNPAKKGRSEADSTPS